MLFVVFFLQDKKEASMKAPEKASIDDSAFESLEKDFQEVKDFVCYNYH